LTDPHEPGKVKVPRYNWESSAFVRPQFRIDRCNSDKVHFNQSIKSKVRMNRMNRLFYIHAAVALCAGQELHVIQEDVALLRGWEEPISGRYKGGPDA
jgi:hypothetical protein